MQNWFVNQKIICIENKEGLYNVYWYENFKIPLVKGKIYTIKKILKTQNKSLGFILNEVSCISKFTNNEYIWDSRRFRPLIEPEPDISIFHSILNKLNEKEKDLLYV